MKKNQIRYYEEFVREINQIRLNWQVLKKMYLKNYETKTFDSMNEKYDYINLNKQIQEKFRINFLKTVNTCLCVFKINVFPRRTME